MVSLGGSEKKVAVAAAILGHEVPLRFKSYTVIVEQNGERSLGLGLLWSFHTGHI